MANNNQLQRKIVNKCASLRDRPITLGEEFPWQPSIYRVPEHLRKLNENAYTPWRVSIGPFHNGNPKFWVMEEHKLAYMEALIYRAAPNTIEGRNNVLSGYINVIQQLEAMAHFCYADQAMESISNNDFVEMLLIDGCFIIEFLLRKIRKLYHVTNEPTKSEYSDMYDFVQQIFTLSRNMPNDSPTHDCIFQCARTSFEVRRDLTLLENQVPYNVLKKLYDYTCEAYCSRGFPSSSNASNQYKKKLKKPTFHEVVYCALRTSIPSISHILNRQQLSDQIKGSKVTNLVSFLKICCRPTPDVAHAQPDIMQNYQDDNDIHWMVPGEPVCFCNLNGRDMKEFRVPSVTQLAKAGIKFKASESPLLKLDFKKGTLEMPAISIWHHTETFIRNVMAYELYTEAAVIQTTTVSDYMCLMDDLINTKEDVALLIEKRIIQNWLESDDVVADIFNSITKHILADHASYSKICRDINEFTQKIIPRYKAILRQDYFNEPKAIIYFITGVIIQTTAAIVEVATSFRSNK